ncbi:hypothetical protein DFJ74DRAFT_110729 [Hyaloraphidium curvatum]|nr:hypothetical protein DFJ74DRAFT_110729 [Hyaloraphidium curvatum]
MTTNAANTNLGAKGLLWSQVVAQRGAQTAPSVPQRRGAPSPLPLVPCAIRAADPEREPGRARESLEDQQPVYIFCDSSNVFRSGRDLAAQRRSASLGRPSTPSPTSAGTPHPPSNLNWRLNYGALLNLLSRPPRDRNLKKALLFGSGSDEEFPKALARAGWEYDLVEPDPNRTVEKEVDVRMSNAMLSFAYEVKYESKAHADCIVCVVTGDRDFLDTVRRIRVLLPNATIELWSWDHSVADVYRHMEQIDLNFLDHHLEELEFYNGVWDRRYGEIRHDRAYVLCNISRDSPGVMAWRHTLGSTFCHLQVDDDLIIIALEDLGTDNLSRFVVDAQHHLDASKPNSGVVSKPASSVASIASSSGYGRRPISRLETPPNHNRFVVVDSGGFTLNQKTKPKVGIEHLLRYRSIVFRVTPAVTVTLQTTMPNQQKCQFGCFCDRIARDEHCGFFHEDEWLTFIRVNIGQLRTLYLKRFPCHPDKCRFNGDHTKCKYYHEGKEDRLCTWCRKQHSPSCYEDYQKEQRQKSRVKTNRKE